MNQPKFMPTLIENTVEVFKQSLISFVENEEIFNENLSLSEQVTLVSKALKDSSNTACRSGLVEFIEGHDELAGSIENEGKTYSFKADSKKSFLSQFGVIEISRRIYYHQNKGRGFVPLDNAIDMAGRYVMPAVVEYLLFGAAMLTPKELESMFDKMCAFTPSASLIQDIINEDGKAFDNFLHAQEEGNNVRAVNLPEEPVTALVASFDGANVLVREPGKKRGARTKKPAKDFNNGKPVEKSCSYKNAMVGAISFYRAEEADNVIDFETAQRVVEPNRLTTHYLGRMPEERYPTFKSEFEKAIKQAEEVAPEGIDKVLLMDGARGFWSYVEQSEIFDDYIQIIDFYHTAEHLSRLAEALFRKGSTDAQVWFEKWVSKLKNGVDSVSALLRSAKRYADLNNLSKSKIEAYQTEITFFQRNKDRMCYSEMVEAGIPIGSGPVEAACKMIVKARFCQSGMRWSIQGGQNVMNLRVVQKSEQWEETWQVFRDTGGYHKHIRDAA